jgi:hypothetical protein
MSIFFVNIVLIIIIIIITVFRYKTIKDKNNATGRGRSSWCYFDLMDELLRIDPAVTPRVTVSSVDGTTRMYLFTLFFSTVRAGKLYTIEA